MRPFMNSPGSHAPDAVMIETDRKESRLEHWDDFWQQKQSVNEIYSNADRILRNLTRITSLDGKRVLEIGAGTGRDSLPLAKHGALVTQLDYSQNALTLLKRLADAEKIPVTIVGGDTFSLPFRKHTFDIVFHQGLLEHVRPAQAKDLLRENIRVLKPGGLLLVDVPQRYHFYTVAKHILMALNRWFAGWERSFSIFELRETMRNEGLTVVHSYGEWMVPSFPYRVTREIMKSIGITLPLYPNLLEPLSRLRSALRRSLLNTPLPLWTGISIGVIARKSGPR